MKGGQVHEISIPFLEKIGVGRYVDLGDSPFVATVPVLTKQRLWRVLKLDIIVEDKCLFLRPGGHHAYLEIKIPFPKDPKLMRHFAGILNELADEVEAEQEFEDSEPS
jgi:hypothetical protein